MRVEEDRGQVKVEGEEGSCRQVEPGVQQDGVHGVHEGERPLAAREAAGLFYRRADRCMVQQRPRMTMSRG